MRKIKNKVYIESKYSGVHLGMVSTSEGVLLVDCPVKVDDTKEWLSQVGEYGVPRYMALLDAHPDRVLGSRVLDLPLIAQDRTLEAIRDWADTFKGSMHPIGADADRLKRITGVQRAAPEVVYSDQMDLLLGDVHFRFLHRPGPQPGSTWILLKGERVAFIGDTVTLDEPPYIGKADLVRWLDALDELRSSAMAKYTLLCGQGGPVKRDDINNMARFLRKVENRLEKMGESSSDKELVESLASELLEDFKVAGPRQEQAFLRLKAGLMDLNAGD